MTMSIRTRAVAGAIGTLSVLGVVAAPASAAPQLPKLPVPRAQTNLTELTSKHHDHPAVDIPVPVGTAVYAVIGGVATRFYEAGGCGYGLNITRGNSVYTYCHGNGTYHVASGATVGAGTLIMRSGNTGSSTGPHLHVQVKIDGQLRCPQNLMKAAWNGTQIDPQSLPSSGCTY
jgi:murein DD-endopeptidase MepM/ murein hydrolase activator NlpD